MDQLITYLESFITPGRKQLFDEILAFRTRYITVVLEDIYQPQNASAVIRSCDCFGIQDIHIVENKNEYRLNPDVTLGSDKWISLTQYNTQQNNTLAALNNLKEKGYRIVATSPHKQTCLLSEFDISKGKTALLFGNELNGLSNDALQHADEFLKIPMYGFTESLNISVSAAIILQFLTFKLTEKNINRELTLAEKQQIKLAWLKSTIKNASLIIDKFNAAHEKSNNE
ncbi:MAG: TrmH family RNA methyltransferase [Bacteroidetes bacterium]|jgi:tRNA (guanosine-2'-O-)-methyltransferase|nr:TrmH family RNA methyltransferase [Bacteroidota bacterium]